MRGRAALQCFELLSMSLPDFRWNRSSEIAPIISTLWTQVSFRKQYQFYGSDRAINSCCDTWIHAYGHKKWLLENKRDFIVRTVLGIPSFYIRHAHFVFLHYRSPTGSHHQWVGTGQYSVFDANEFIESMAPYDPMMLLIQIDISPIYQTLKPLLQFSDENAAPDNSASGDSVPDPLIAEALALFDEGMRSERTNEQLVPDGSSFDRAIVLEGAILGFAAIVEHGYLNEHYPGYKVQRQAVKEHGGRSFDVVALTTADGKSKTLYFALSKLC